jgi:hypothetical protein
VTEVEKPVDPAEAPAPRQCPRCAAEVEAVQEYCLECGLRLPYQDPRAAERAPVVAERPASGWLLPALLGLLIAAAGTVAAIAISDAGGEPTAIPVATGGTRTVTEETPTLTAPEPTTPATTAAPPPPTTTARPPATTAPPRPRTIRWPAGRRGWTIVLLSVPQGNGRGAAEKRAAQARRSGLQNVGILNSSRFASLHPGYYVVFTGVFESEAEATGALSRARGAFPLAYSRQVVP